MVHIAANERVAPGIIVRQRRRKAPVVGLTVGVSVAVRALERVSVALSRHHCKVRSSVISRRQYRINFPGLGLFRRWANVNGTSACSADVEILSTAHRGMASPTIRMFSRTRVPSWSGLLGGCARPAAWSMSCVRWKLYGLETMRSGFDGHRVCSCHQNEDPNGQDVKTAPHVGRRL